MPMAYSISYREEVIPTQHSKKTKGKIVLGFAAAVFAMMLLFNALFPGQVRALRRALLPFADEGTISAFSQMTRDITDGAPAGDAITAFCVEVLREAE